MTNLDSILKSRDITLPTKVCLVKAMVFPVKSCVDVRVGLWRKLSAKELMLLNWCWRRLLRVPWTARRSNQSILKEISPEYSLEGLMLKLKLQYFGHLMGRADSLEKTLRLAKIEGRRRRWQKMRWWDGITNWMDMSLSKPGSCWWTGKPGALQSMGLWGVRHDWATELYWTEQDGCKEYIYMKKRGKIKKKNLPSKRPFFKGIFVFSSLEYILLKDRKHSEHCGGPHTWWLIQPQWVYFSSQSSTWG